MANPWCKDLIGEVDKEDLLEFFIVPLEDFSLQQANNFAEIDYIEYIENSKGGKDEER